MRSSFAPGAAILWLGLSLTVAAAHAAPAPDLYQLSYAQEEAGDYKAALETLESIQAPDNATYVFALRRGWLAYLRSEHDKSIASYEAAARKAPGALEPKLGLMLPQMAKRRWVDAITTAKDVLAIAPKNYLAMSRVAYCQYNLGRYREAEATYAAVLALYPSDVEMRAGLGWSLLKQGETQRAATAFRTVLGVAPRHVSANEGLRASRR